MRYNFGRHTLDLDTAELRNDGRLVELEPQALAVLTYLIRNRHRVVPKGELLDEIWGDRFVSESALTTRIKQCRRAVGDSGTAQQVILTVHRLGYRFVVDVREEPAHRAAGPVAGLSPRGVPAGPAGLATGPRPTAPQLFGRQRELATLLERLEKHRLVTVTGAGGVGKSTLTAHLLTSGSKPATGDPWWCELANTRDPDALATMVLAALGEGQQVDADPLESALRVLQRREAVLVLDNCEHLATAAASFAASVLRSCPAVRIVATSRVPLQVRGESLLPLNPLDLEDAVAFFCARAVDAGGQVDPADPAVTELCRRLDGIPLALELAAGRTRSLTTNQMVELLQHRFRLLTDPAGNDDDRHQSLVRTIRWSWEALQAPDRELLASLSVLVGPFSLEDAVALSPGGGDSVDVADALERLVRASLVATSPEAGPLRHFRLLETIRDFAAERLEDPAGARRRHSRHFASLAEWIDGDLLQSDAIDDGLAAMTALWDNLRAAVGYAAEQDDVRTVRRIIRAAGPCADLYQSYELLDWCAHADLDPTRRPETDVALAAEALAIRARMLAHRGQHERARVLADAAHAWHESHTTLLSVVWCAYYEGDLDRVVESASRLTELSRSPRGMDRAFADGFAAVVVGVRQETEITESPVTPELAQQGALGTLDCLVAGFRLCAADPVRGAELLEAVVVAALENDYRLLLGAAASTLTQITLPGQPPPDAMRTLRRTLTAYRDRGMWVLITADMVMAARLLADAGDVDTACRLLGARAASGYNVGLSEVLRAELVEELSAADRERFDQLTAQGAHWSPPEAADVAISALSHQLSQ